MSNKIEKRGKKLTTGSKYLGAVAWFSVLWAVKVFVLEPTYKKIKK